MLQHWVQSPKKIGNQLLAEYSPMIKLKSDDSYEITGAQIRAARGLVRWSAKDLANAAAVGVATISRAEVHDGRPPVTIANLKAIQQALEGAGIEFIPMNGGGVGVRFRNR